MPALGPDTEMSPPASTSTLPALPPPPLPPSPPDVLMAFKATLPLLPTVTEPPALPEPSGTDWPRVSISPLTAMPPVPAERNTLRPLFVTASTASRPALSVPPPSKVSAPPAGLTKPPLTVVVPPYVELSDPRVRPLATIDVPMAAAGRYNTVAGSTASILPMRIERLSERGWIDNIPPAAFRLLPAAKDRASVRTSI